MRKKTFNIAAVVIAMAVSGINAYVNKNTTDMSTIALINIEALAGEENSEKPKTCGTHDEIVNDVQPCQMDNLYREGRSGIDYSRAEGNDSEYLSGFEGAIYVCASPDPYESHAETYKCQ